MHDKQWDGKKPRLRIDKLLIDGKSYTYDKLSVKLNIIFSASNELSKLCKLKCTLPIVKQSNVIYKVACGNCTEFYIGKSN